MNFIYNVPYLSEINPIENVFSILRNELNRHPNETYNEIITTISNFRKTIKEETLPNIFNHSIKFLTKLLKHE
jgi:hypothetical protein